MHILIHDELPSSYNAQVQLLYLSAGWRMFDFDQVKQARKAGYTTPDYYAVYAVEGDEVLAKVDVLRVDVETTKGLETMTGVSGVLTRRDKSRQGLARQLFLDMHKREKESRVPHLILWTGRNNTAHNLYESLGYKDIYGPTVALLKSRVQPLQDTTAIDIRNATNEDILLLDDLHSKITKNRLGFNRRFKGFMQLWWVTLGFEKSDNIRIFTKQGEPVGYAQFQQDVGSIRSYEIVVEPQHSEDAVKLLEREAKGNWLALGDTFVTDNRDLLTKRGYVFADYSYTTLMGVCLDDPDEDMSKLLGTRDPRFVCHYSDHF